MRSFTDHVERARVPRCTSSRVALSEHAVVGAIDFRMAAAHAKTGKGMGPAGVPSDIFSFAQEELTRIWDPVVVEATLSLDLPIQDQGGDNFMLIKSPLKPAQSLANRREILLANQEPKLAGGIVRKRVTKLLGDTVVKSQWGDGFGAASCELAHLGVEAYGSIGVSRKLTVVRIFIDVVQAFASAKLIESKHLHRYHMKMDTGCYQDIQIPHII